jgi:hypothetical protein
MNRNIDGSSRRILLIDDNPAIHRDFRKIFGPGLSSAVLSASEADLQAVQPAEECREVLLELAQRSSFTDTLRLRTVRAPGTEPRPADGGDRKTRAARAE